MNLLLVEDDPELSRIVQQGTHSAGHDCLRVPDGESAIKACQGMVFDAVILDVNLPRMSGFEVIERLRADMNRVPVIFLTAHDGVTDRVRGFKLGGDDYLTKPFDMEELLARLEALHRRNVGIPSVQQRRIGGWLVNSKQHMLESPAGQIALQPRECALLELMIDNPDRVLTKHFLLDRVWNIRFDPGTNVVDSMVCRLRRSLEAANCDTAIETARGKGYVFHPPA